MILKPEQTRQRTLAARKGLPPPRPIPYAQTRLGIARGVSSWNECLVPLTAVVNREIDSDGEIRDWVLVTTSTWWSAQQTRGTYALLFDSRGCRNLTASNRGGSEPRSLSRPSSPARRCPSQLSPCSSSIRRAWPPPASALSPTV